MVNIGVVGGTGYTGMELLPLLAQHPRAVVLTITSRGNAGTSVAEMCPGLRECTGLRFEDPAKAAVYGLPEINR